MGEHIACFKAYDIRGQVPDDLDTDLARRIGRAFVAQTGAKKVVVGYDIRDSSIDLSNALIDGFVQAGVDVINIGLCGTEMVYFGAMSLEAEGVDGGVMVTASHNPKGYNGMKSVSKGSRPISGDTGLKDIERRAAQEDYPGPVDAVGKVEQRDISAAYIEHLLGYVDLDTLKPLKIVATAGNGCAGPTLDLLAEHLPFSFERIHHAPDGTFPNGVPNPLLVENRGPTIDAIKASGADLGIAWDGDFDRCFFFDQQGDFVEGYYIVGLLADAILQKNPGAAIIHDPRLCWNTVEMVEKAGGKAIMSKTGHAFIKERMRQEDAVYGGEMSAHHYFKDFAYCDSGMIPWLLVTSIMSRTGKSLRELVAERMAAYPASGEINRKLQNPDAAIARVREKYATNALDEDHTDGVSFTFANWRLNLRKSNTEPVLRLNVESRGDRALMEEKTAEVLGVIES